MKLALSVLLLAASSLCSAAPALTPTFDACMDKAEGETPATLACISAETARQDAQLNTAYKGAQNATPKDRQAKLREAQRNWLKFRDANCGFFADASAGQAAAVDSASCVMTMTAARGKELSAIEVQMAARY